MGRQLPSSDRETPNAVIRPRILVVEDDTEIAAEIAAELRDHDYDPAIAGTGPEGLASAMTGAFSLIVMDRMLPGMDGLTLIERLREAGIRTPVLVLSALGEVNERVRGLRAGSNDYLTKPFALNELIARIEVLLRPQTSTSMRRAGSLTLDLIQRVAWRHGKRIDLSPREFTLLEYLTRNAGQLVTRAMLLEHVWNYRFILQSNAVDVHIGKLRRKIDLPGEASLIASVRGQGFIFVGDHDGTP